MFLAHGVGGRSDLPAPLWLAMYAAGAVVLASFVILVTFWSSPRFTGINAGRPVPAGMQRLLDSRPPRIVLAVVGLLLYLATLVVLIFGGDSAATNPAPTWVYVWLWVGLPAISVLFGPVWRLVNPLRTVTSGIRAALPGALRPSPDRQYPERLGYWPAAAALLVFVWLELAYREAARPSTLLAFVLLYSVVQVFFGLRYGNEWFARGDGFEVYSELLGRFSVLGRRVDNEFVLRNPFNGLASLRPRPGLVAVVCVLLGSTAFDGFARTRFWTGLADRATEQPANALLGTAGLAGSIGLVFGLFLSATVGTAGVRGAVLKRTGMALPPLFAHSLLPIVFGYTVAHYFSYFVFQGQAGYLLATDPFGLGWSLFGPAGRGIDYLVVSTTLIGFVQVGAIVVGHVAGVIAAHDRAMEVFPRKEQLRAQIPLVTTMIIFTLGGIGLVVGSG